MVSSHETHLQNGSINGVSFSERRGERKKERLRKRCGASSLTDLAATLQKCLDKNCDLDGGAERPRKCVSFL